MSIDVQIAADSTHPKSNSPRLTTMLLRYPRMVHSEFMTHREFSRSASSSRAVPIQRMIDDVRDDVAYPSEWGKHQPGMQAERQVSGETAELARDTWASAAACAVRHANELKGLGLHKQVVNRILEPFSHISVIVSSTEWDNFFRLRCHADADPTMRDLAETMQQAYDQSTPTETMFHVPLVPEFNADKPLRMYMRVSAARCARVSYLNHEGKKPDMEADLTLAQKLLDSEHMSPFEHQAIAVRTSDKRLSRNFNGWIQHRAMVELE